MFIFLIATIAFISGVNATPPPFLSKVTIEGSFLEKERFVQSYPLAPGDPFDKDKHEQFLESMKKTLQDEGYLDALVEDKKELSSEMKVQVTLTLVLGKRYTIKEVLLSLSEKAIYQELLRALQGLLKGQHCTRGLLKQSASLIKEFCSSHNYSQRKLSYRQTKNTTQTVTVEFFLELIPKKRQSFGGNIFYTDEQLATAYSHGNLKGLELPPCFFEEELKALYKKRGFFEISVTSEETLDRTLYTIEEGPRTIITAVSSEGDTDEGRKVLEEACSVLCHDYDEDALRKVLAECRAALQAQGYWDAVVKKKALILQEASSAKLVVSFKCGEQRMVQEIIIPSYPFLLLEKPFKAYCSLSEPCPLSLEAVQNQKFFLQDFLRKKGYLYVAPSFTLEEREGKKVLAWALDLSEGPVRFGKTTINGLVRTNPLAVVRELSYQEGDPWDQQALEYSVQRLKMLGIFSSVSLGPASTAMQVQPLLLKCVEDDPFEIRTRLGFQLVSKSFTHLSWTTYKVGGSFLWKNPTGYADLLGCDLDFTRYTRIIAAHYEVPWIGPWPIRTVFKLYSDRFDQPLISRADERLYKEMHEGGCLTFIYLRPWGESYLKIGCERNTVHILSERLARVIELEPRLVDSPTPYLYIEPSLRFESVDIKGDPSYGWTLIAGLKAMIPFGIKNGWFIRALVQNCFFYPFLPSIVGAFRWQCGHIFNAQFSTILPTERFYLGGSTSVRGYETNMVPPLNDVVCEGSVFWVPVGGKTVGALNAELRIALYSKLSGVLFIDGGILTQNKFADIAANRWFGASGFGIRWATPIGPVRFDIGWKWRKRDPKDTSYAFFLTMGQAF